MWAKASLRTRKPSGAGDIPAPTDTRAQLSTVNHSRDISAKALPTLPLSPYGAPINLPRMPLIAIPVVPSVRSSPRTSRSPANGCRLRSIREILLSTTIIVNARSVTRTNLRRSLTIATPGEGGVSTSLRLILPSVLPAAKTALESPL
jgi:hypothetical protein